MPFGRRAETETKARDAILADIEKHRADGNDHVADALSLIINPPPNVNVTQMPKSSVTGLQTDGLGGYH